MGDVPAESIHPAFLMCDAWMQNEIGLEQTKVEYAKGDLCESMWVGGWMSGWMDGGFEISRSIPVHIQADQLTY